MTRFTQWVADNVDALLALVGALAIAILSVFDIGNLVGPDVVQNSTLAVLALVSGVLLRDRFQQAKTRDAFIERIETVAEAMDHVPARVERLIADEPVLQDLRNTLQETTLIRVVSGTLRRQLVGEATRSTDRWVFRGGTGTVMARTILPECVSHARLESRPLHVRIEVFNPLDPSVCESYARFAQSLSTDTDGGNSWTADRARREVYATVLATCWYRQRYSLLNVEIGLSATTTTLQWDVTAQWASLASTEPEVPVLLARRGSPFYDRWAADLQRSLDQAQRLPLEAARTLRFADEPSIEETRRLFVLLGVPLPSSWDERAVSEVIALAIGP